MKEKLNIVRKGLFTDFDYAFRWNVLEERPSFMCEHNTIGGVIHEWEKKHGFLRYHKFASFSGFDINPISRYYSRVYVMFDFPFIFVRCFETEFPSDLPF